MQKLIIKNFGPIKDAEIDIHPFMVLIGPQASGKSTIAKLAYFFLHLSNDFVNILLRQDVQDQRAKKEGIFARAIRARFQNLFGSPELHHAMKVTFEYDNGEQLVLTRHPADPRLVDFTTDSELWKKLGELAKLAASQWTSFTPEVVNDFRVWSDSMDKLNSMYRTGAQKVFSFEREVVFIPANRSIVTFTAFLGEQPYSQYSRFFDRATEIFIGAVNYIRPRITVPLASLIREEEFVGNGNPPEGATELAGMIREILKGEYKYDEEGGKLVVEGNVEVDLRQASAGQQDSIWILYLLFDAFLKRTQPQYMIEEPEAFLHTGAQKRIVEFLAQVHNLGKFQFLLTTHSPYVLATVNNLMLAHHYGSQFPEEVERIIPRDRWLNPATTRGFLVDNGTVKSLNDDDLGMLKNEELDPVTGVLGADFNALMDLEHRVHSHD